MFSLYGIDILLLIDGFARIFRSWDIWANELMLTFVSESVVDGGFRITLLAFLGTGFLFSSEFWNSTCWKLDEFAGGGAGGAMIFAMVDAGRVYLLPMNIGNGIDMVGCLSSTLMVPSLSSSAEWAEKNMNWC